MKFFGKRWIASLLILLLLPVMLTGCNSQEEPSQTTNRTSTTAQTAAQAYPLVSSGTLTVGTCPYYPPFTYQDDDKIAGLDAALMEMIAYQLDLQLDMQPVDTVENSLEEGKIDVIASAYPFGGAEQMKNFALTDAYYTLELVMVVRTDSTYQVANDLKGKAVSCYYGFLFYWDDPDPLNVSAQSSFLSQIEELLRGNVEGALMERHTAERYRDIYSGQMQILEGDWEPCTLHLAVSKDNTALLDALNNCIREMKANGTLDQLIEEQMI